jgi:hypothetical protein
MARPVTPASRRPEMTLHPRGPRPIPRSPRSSVGVLQDRRAATARSRGRRRRRGARARGCRARHRSPPRGARPFVGHQSIMKSRFDRPSIHHPKCRPRRMTRCSSTAHLASSGLLSSCPCSCASRAGGDQGRPGRPPHVDNSIHRMPQLCLELTASKQKVRRSALIVQGPILLLERGELLKAAPGRVNCGSLTPRVHRLEGVVGTRR